MPPSILRKDLGVHLEFFWIHAQLHFTWHQTKLVHAQPDKHWLNRLRLAHCPHLHRHTQEISHRSLSDFSWACTLLPSVFLWKRAISLKLCEKTTTTTTTAAWFCWNKHRCTELIFQKISLTHQPKLGRGSCVDVMFSCVFIACKNKAHSPACLRPFSDTEEWRTQTCKRQVVHSIKMNLRPPRNKLRSNSLCGWCDLQFGWDKLWTYHMARNVSHFAVTGFPTWGTIVIGNIAAVFYTTLVRHAASSFCLDTNSIERERGTKLKTSRSAAELRWRTKVRFSQE